MFRFDKSSYGITNTYMTYFSRRLINYQSINYIMPSLNTNDKVVAFNTNFETSLFPFYYLSLSRKSIQLILKSEFVFKSLNQINYHTHKSNVSAQSILFRRVLLINNLIQVFIVNLNIFLTNVYATHRKPICNAKRILVQLDVVFCCGSSMYCSEFEFKDFRSHLSDV